MAYFFGDGFDCYAAVADAILGYWDSGTTNTNYNLTAGRFAGSQALRFIGATATLVKSSGANDSVHHFVLAFQQTATLTGTTLGFYIQLMDAGSNQCCVVFRSDGAMLLTSGGPAGTVLDTYTGAVSSQNTWFAFEVEVVINNTTGSWAVRKNGNTSNDRTLGSLNTRAGTTNNYANRITLSQNAAVNAQLVDDILWRSDASSVPWVGDIRCYTRMPVSDASVQFSRAPTTLSQTAASGASANNIAAGVAKYCAFTSGYDGTIGSATVSINVGYTGNLKCSIFANAAGVPTGVLGSATTAVNPAASTLTLTFPSPVSVAKGVQYWLGFDSDTAVTNGFLATAAATCLQSTTAYAAFPAANPVTSASQGPNSTVVITVTTNNCMVNETLQDGATSYVYDSTVSDADFYTIAPLAGTPSSTIGVTTRGFLQKSDAGARGAAVQLKSGASTQTSTPTLLSTSWGWLFRSDTVDPATSAAWTATGVNNAQIGPKITS